MRRLGIIPNHACKPAVLDRPPPYRVPLAAGVNSIWDPMAEGCAGLGSSRTMLASLLYSIARLPVDLLSVRDREQAELQAEVLVRTLGRERAPRVLGLVRSRRHLV